MWRNALMAQRWHRLNDIVIMMHMALSFRARPAGAGMISRPTASMAREQESAGSRTDNRLRETGNPHASRQGKGTFTP